VHSDERIHTKISIIDQRPDILLRFHTSMARNRCAWGIGSFDADSQKGDWPRNWPTDCDDASRMMNQCQRPPVMWPVRPHRRQWCFRRHLNSVARLEHRVALGRNVANSKPHDPERPETQLHNCQSRATSICGPQRCKPVCRWTGRVHACGKATKRHFRGRLGFFFGFSSEFHTTTLHMNLSCAGIIH